MTYNKFVLPVVVLQYTGNISLDGAHVVIVPRLRCVGLLHMLIRLRNRGYRDDKCAWKSFSRADLVVSPRTATSST